MADLHEVPAAVREAVAALAEPRPMRRGSFSERYMKCSKPSCACGRDEQARHGPYFSLTRNLGGQTQSRLVPAEQVERVREQILAGKQFRQQVDAYWAACEQWADAETAGQRPAGEAEKRGSRRRSRRKSRAKPRR